MNSGGRTTARDGLSDGQLTSALVLLSTALVAALLLQ